MMIKRIHFTAITLTLLLSTLCSAAPYYGATLSIPLITKEPENLRGFQFMLSYDPQKYQWRKFNVYFDGGFSHFTSNTLPYYSTVNIYSLAPVIRYTFRRRGPILPYLEMSIGPAYLNHTRLDGRNLGIHFAFQDRMGVGALLGKSERLSLGVHAVHYSNARLSAHNSGLTVPLVLDIGYRFD
jgi:hypothetical protein